MNRLRSSSSSLPSFQAAGEIRDPRSADPRSGDPAVRARLGSREPRGEVAAKRSGPKKKSGGITNCQLPNYMGRQRGQGQDGRWEKRALEANPHLNHLRRSPVSARQGTQTRVFASANTQHTHCRGRSPSGTPWWGFTGGVWEVACCSGEPGWPGWAQDTAKTEVGGRNGTWTQLGRS
jgi:hypothetical protein